MIKIVPKDLKKKREGEILVPSRNVILPFIKGEVVLNNKKAKGGKKKQISPKKWWFFTHNNYTEEDVTEILTSEEIFGYAFQKEIGDKGTPHLQGLINFVDKVRPKSLGGVFERIHFEIPKNRAACKNYCTKFETRIGETMIKKLIIPRKLKIIQTLRVWQKTLENKILKDLYDDRKIMWYWEDQGKVGKTQFCKYLIHHYDALLVEGKGGDVKYLINKYIEMNKCAPDIVLYNIPRSYVNYVNYGALEGVKDGLFVSTKYECNGCLMNSPIVICFANSEPQLDKLSDDKWNVVQINNVT